MKEEEENVDEVDPRPSGWGAAYWPLVCQLHEPKKDFGEQ